MLDIVRDAWMRGWSLVPVQEDKHPHVRWKEFQETRASFDQIQIWSTHFTPAAWAVVTGAVSGIIALDFDGPAGEITLGTLGLEPHVRTGSGGAHVYCTHPGIPVPTVNSRSKRALAEAYPGLDFRGDGGYAIFAGRNQSGEYHLLRPLDPIDFQTLPTNLRAWLTASELPDLGTLAAIQRLIRRAQKDAALAGRNNAAFWLACQLRDLGQTKTETGAILETDFRNGIPDTNLKGKQEAFYDREISSLLDQVWKRPPRVSTTLRGTVLQQGDDPIHNSDMGNARRLVDLYGLDLRYCHTWQRWLLWDGTRFRPDETGEIHRLARETVKRMYADSARIADEEIRKNMATHAIRSEASRCLNAMIEVAKTDLRIALSSDDLDQNPWLLNCLNGTMDLRTGVLREASREDLITKCTSSECPPLDDGRVSPRWDEFLFSVMAQRIPLMAFMHRALGYAITGNTGEQAIFILHGSGANGKSTLLDCVLTILGDYACYTPASSIQLQRGETIPNDLARLKGYRLVAAMEMDEGRRLAESLVKQMTGREKITARFMRGEWFEFRPEFTVFLATNHRPEIRGTDHAIWRRIRLIPFDTTIPDAEQDHDLPAKLLEESPAILAWLVRGSMIWNEEGLGESPEVTEATSNYRSESDTLAEFVAVVVSNLPGNYVSSGDMYKAYLTWWGTAGEKPMSRRMFSNRLLERGLRMEKGTGNKHYWCDVTVIRG